MQDSTLKILGKQQIAAASDVQNALIAATQVSKDRNQFIDRVIGDELPSLDLHPEGVVFAQRVLMLDSYGICHASHSLNDLRLQMYRNLKHLPNLFR